MFVRAFLLGAALTAPLVGGAFAVEINGGGATFPAPLYYAWIEALKDAQPDLQVRYESVGSGEGIRLFSQGEVDFGASDALMSDAEIAAVDGGALFVPATAGMVVLAYNLPDVDGTLRLSREALVGIFSGEIAAWNDPLIQADNPDLALPKRNITLVVRRDGSGTTYAFTQHLSAVSEAWRDKGPGAGTLVDFPGSAMTAYGNDGVAGRIRISYDSIGYVEYGYAKRLGLPVAALQNRDGSFVEPSEAAGTAALDATAAEMPADGRQLVTDPAGAAAYPIVTYSWLLLYEIYDDPQVLDGIRRFVGWGLEHGQTLAGEMSYVPLPQSVVARSKALLDQVRGPTQ